MTTITLEEIADGLRSQLKMACQAARQEAAVADKALRDLAAAQEALSAKDAELASVKAHAEAMAVELSTMLKVFRNYQGSSFLAAHAALDAYRAALDAYRAAHPKDAP